MATPSTLVNTVQQQSEPEPNKENVVSAIELGWSLVELLGRCFTLELPTAEQQLRPASSVKHWDGEKRILISPSFNSQKRLKGLVCFIQSLLKKMQLDTGDNNKHVECLSAKVDELCTSKSRKDPETKKLLGEINECIYAWDWKIREEMQKGSEQFRNNYDCVNAYMVGKGFAAFRWYDTFSPLDRQARTKNQTTKDILSQATTVDESCFVALEEHVQLLSPYLCRFAPTALVNSARKWKKSILNQKIYDHDGKEVCAGLKRQADIWYSLLTAQRDLITYVIPTAVTWGYNLRVVRFALPYVWLGLLLALTISLGVLVLIGLFWPIMVAAFSRNAIAISIFTSVGTGFSLLVGLSTAIPSIKALWQWATQRAKDKAEASGEKVLDNMGELLTGWLWDAAQQSTINKATYVKPGTMYPACK